jgi:hypothetical protein
MMSSGRCAEEKSRLSCVVHEYAQTQKQRGVKIVAGRPNLSYFPKVAWLSFHIHSMHTIRARHEGRVESYCHIDVVTSQRVNPERRE